MELCKILVPVGACGAGINEKAFAEGLELKPDCIAMDAGSTDSGPYYLAKGICKYSDASVKHDLEISIAGAVKLGIPLFISSCGTSGSDPALKHVFQLAEEIINEYKYKIRVATISSQIKPEVLAKKWDEGKVHALSGAPEIRKEDIFSCSNIVGLMGAEPYIEAYKNGAQIILGGRGTDTGVIAAFPLMKGMPEGICWHAAKVVECGSQCSDTSGVCVMLEVDSEGFTVYPTVKEAHCTPYTVSAHLMYENTNPFYLTEPSGSFITKDAVYTQISPNACRVTGSKFEPAEQYTMKIEGARLVGYQNISLVGIANSDVLENLDEWTAFLSKHVQGILDRNGIERNCYSFDLRCYGYNAVVPIGENETYIPREIGLLLTVTADTQELATTIAKEFNPYLLHLPKDLQSAKELLPTYAFPFSPVDTPRGPIYEFVFHHVIDVEEPLELVKINYTDF